MTWSGTEHPIGSSGRSSRRVITGIFFADRPLVHWLMQYAFSALSDVGRCRQNNEDSVAFDVAARVAVLADGMGGYNAGEVASAMATSQIRMELARWLLAASTPPALPEIKRAIHDCVAGTNASILHAASSNPNYTGMGTTLVLAVFLHDSVTVGHLGDSRCYRWRACQLQRITKDHSLLQQQIDAGRLSMDQARRAPHKNLVTRALGVNSAVQLELQTHAVQSGDVYLLCSDGLSDMLPDQAIAAILQTGTPLAQLASLLVADANQNGGRDNITVLLAQATADSAPV